MAREASLLGRWLGDDLPTWGKVGTHLDRVSPFWGAECLDGGASRATIITRGLDCLADARLVERHHRLSCFLCRCPSYVTARAIGSTGGDKHGRLGAAVLLVLVGLLKAALDSDDPLRARHLELEVGVVGTTMNLTKHGRPRRAW
jgi:hypothetical protein